MKDFTACATASATPAAAHSPGEIPGTGLDIAKTIGAVFIRLISSRKVNLRYASVYMGVFKCLIQSAAFFDGESIFQGFRSVRSTLQMPFESVRMKSRTPPSRSSGAMAGDGAALPGV